jgi:purine-binding chemotaxis protein CheW
MGLFHRLTNRDSSSTNRDNQVTEEKSTNALADDHYDQDDNTQKDRYLTFHLANEDFGLEIRFVTEIVLIQKITKIPDLPEFVSGVINLRGKLIPVMDVRLRFNLPPREFDNLTCIIVVGIKDSSVGLVVDEVREVLSIPAAQVEPPPATSKGRGNRYIKGIGKTDEEVKILLDAQQLFLEEDLEFIGSSLTKENHGE